MNTKMVRTFRKAFVVVFFALLHVYAGAQAIENTLAAYADKYMQERAYMHYDKSIYAAGETVWFKAYVLEGILPAQGSKTLYVDWVDEAGTVLMHSVSPLVDAVTNGQFEIPSDYAGNFVHVRAYTAWMLNFDTSFLYNKAIRVIGKTQSPAPKRVAGKTDLQFFAEGGDAIAGIKNKIAFKAADQWGTPVAVTGVVQNNQGAVVASFKAQHNGMGFFYLEPQQGVAYTAKWKDAKGVDHSTPLPVVKSNGINLQVTIEGVKKRFSINRSNDAPENVKQLHVVGTMGETFVFKAAVDLSNRTAASGLVPTENLSSGILTITVFNSEWHAVAERICFVNNNDYYFTPQLTVEHWGLNRRARNEIQIAVPDSIDAHFSVAVTDNALAADSSDNIITRLLLTSDIKGYVHHPEYYFTSNSDSVQQHLDLVMLTHGWRRFKWEDVVKGKMPAIAYPKDTAYLTLSGKLYGVPQGLTNGGTIAMIIKTKDSGSKMVTEVIKPDGSFNNPDAFFFDTLQVYYQLQPASVFGGAEVRFMQSRLRPLLYKRAAQDIAGYSPYWDTTGRYRLSLLALEQAKVDELMQQKVLENVTVRTKQKSPVQVLDEKYTSGLFRGSESYQFDLVHDPLSRSYNNIFSYLQGKVAGLQISGTGNQTSLQWRGGTPAIYLNEFNTDVSMLSSLAVSDVAYIKVFRPPFTGGSNGSNGAIVIYTRKGNDVPVTSGKGLNNNTITGYSPVKQFYTPNYSRLDPRHEQRDVRTTLYWNPAVQTAPGKHTVTLTFYNNDITSAFRVVLEGMTKDGRLAHTEQVME